MKKIIIAIFVFVCLSFTANANYLLNYTIAPSCVYPGYTCSGANDDWWGTYDSFATIAQYLTKTYTIANATRIANIKVWFKHERFTSSDTYVEWYNYTSATWSKSFFGGGYIGSNGLVTFNRTLVVSDGVSITNTTGTVGLQFKQFNNAGSWNRLYETAIEVNYSDEIPVVPPTPSDLARPQKCRITIQTSDDHTTKSIDNYQTGELSDGLEYQTDVANVKIRSLDGDIKKKSTKKDVDRYTFDFEFNDKKIIRQFVVSSDEHIYPRSNSKYGGHFVIWNDKTKTGNWLDFEEDSENYRYEIIKNNDKEYVVVIYPIIPENQLEFDKNDNDKNIKKVKNLKQLEKTYGKDKFSFKSIGGTNIETQEIEFYIGSYVSFNASNLFNNQNFSGFYVNLTSIDAEFPTSYENYFVDAYNISGGLTNTSLYLWDLVNGTYNIRFASSYYLPRSYDFTINQNHHLLNYSTSQSTAAVYARNALTLGPLTYFNLGTVGLNNSYSSYYPNISDSYKILYLDTGNYTYNATKEGFSNQTGNYSTDYLEEKIIYADLGFIAHLYLYDERTNTPFNVSSADKIELQLKCPDGTFTTLVTTNDLNVPINCQFIGIRFLLTYGIYNYYRNFILTPAEALNATIYLINALDTGYIDNSFYIDDLLGEYENVSVYVKKNIEGVTYQITSDYVDAENKIVAYLILNNDYTIEIHSTNKPVLSLGNYFAASRGDKSLKVYQVSTGTPEEDISYYVTKNNISDDMYVVGYYNDTTNTYTNVTFEVRETNAQGTLLYSTSVNASNVLFMYNMTPNINQTLYAQIIAYNPVTPSMPRQTGSIVNIVTAIHADILNYVDQTFLNWFFVILIGVIALYSTIQTANGIALVLVIFAGGLAAFGWFGVSAFVLVFAGLLAFGSILKENAG